MSENVTEVVNLENPNVKNIIKKAVVEGIKGGVEAVKADQKAQASKKTFEEI